MFLKEGSLPCNLTPESPVLLQLLFPTSNPVGTWLHTWQLVLGCEEDGSKGGFLHYGYNGWDFISFDKETLRWVAAHPQAEKVKEKWEEDPEWSERNKDFLEETCIEWLQRYLSYQKEVLKKTEPPVGKLTHKEVDDSLEVLTCQAFGFYHKEIQATWTRDGEVWKYETLHRNMAPNSDGTYFVRLSIDIDPKERDRFQCHLEHKGLQEPLVLLIIWVFFGCPAEETGAGKQVSEVGREWDFALTFPQEWGGNADFTVSFPCHAHRTSSKNF
uniref:Ig-like domain-containing protein n=1 Tax=Naja naja TaxID=35670 RepID=A0A8C6VDW8_NAJNA